MSTKILSAIVKEPETRTTCTLSLEGNASLDYLTKEFGLTQKQAFNFFITKDGINNDVMNLASTPNNISSQRQVRKSLVVTKKNLKLLNNAAEKSGLQRDVIVDVAFKYLATALKSATALQKEQHIKANETLNNLLDHVLKIETVLKGSLDDSDEILSRFSIVIVVLSNLVNDIENNIQNGTPIDPDGM
jgi:hypothetical protein